MPPLNSEKLAQAKSLGFSDRQIAHLTGTTEDKIRAQRKEIGLVPSYRLVDTCAAEFEAYTPYYYSTYDRGDDEVKGNTAKNVLILGGGPNRIGQGIEFDYYCVHAAFALKEDGFEPLTLEDVLHIYEREQCWGAIAQFGGQTPLNLALGLQKNGVQIIGTSPQSIEIAEDRKLVAAMLPTPLIWCPAISRRPGTTTCNCKLWAKLPAGCLISTGLSVFEFQFVPFLAFAFSSVPAETDADKFITSQSFAGEKQH